jgi:hypothetical protein
MRLSTSFLVFFSLFVGCTSTIEVRLDEPTNNDRVFNYSQLNTRIQRVAGTLVCVDGTEYETLGAFVGADSTVFTDAPTGILRRIPTSRISKIQVKDYGAGTFTGCVVGFLSGLGIGTALITLTRDRSSISQIDTYAAAAALLGGGTLAGAIVGSFVGSTREYVVHGIDSTRIPPPASRRWGAP